MKGNRYSRFDYLISSKVVLGRQLRLNRSCGYDRCRNARSSDLLVFDRADPNWSPIMFFLGRAWAASLSPANISPCTSGSALAAAGSIVVAVTFQEGFAVELDALDLHLKYHRPYPPITHRLGFYPAFRIQAELIFKFGSLIAEHRG